MKQVLLVEDDPLRRTVVEDMFKYNDVPGELVCVESGEEALAAIPALNPPVILMDICLPGISGVEAAEEIKSNPLTKHICVWAITPPRRLRRRCNTAVSSCLCWNRKRPV